MVLGPTNFRCIYHVQRQSLGAENFFWVPIKSLSSNSFVYEFVLKIKIRNDIRDSLQFPCFLGLLWESIISICINHPLVLPT
jgi:hypothetical protein